MYVVIAIVEASVKLSLFQLWVHLASMSIHQRW